MFLLLLTSCTPELEPNKRILVKGFVLDSEGRGLSGHEVNVYTRRSSGFFIFSYGEDEYLIGSGKTISDGSFSVTSLSDRDDDFAITIDGKESYTDYSYATETQNYSPPDLIYELGNVLLKKKAKVNYTITRISGAGISISYSFSFQSPNCYEVYEEGVLNPQVSDCFTDVTINGFLNDNAPDISREFTTVLGSVITFMYSIDEQPMITETFTVDQTNDTYEFTY